MTPCGSMYTPKHLCPQLNPLQSKNTSKHVVTERSVLQQVHVAVSVSMEKAMPEYLKVPVVMDKTMTQQMSEEISEGTVANRKGRP